MANDIKINEAEKIKQILKTHTSPGILFWKSHGDILLEKIAPLQTVAAILNQVKQADPSLKQGLINDILEWAKISPDHIFHTIIFPDDVVKIIHQKEDEKLSSNLQNLITKIKQGGKEDLVTIAKELIFSLITKPMTTSEVQFFVESLERAVQEEKNRNEPGNGHTP